MACYRDSFTFFYVSNMALIWFDKEVSSLSLLLHDGIKVICDFKAGRETVVVTRKIGGMWKLRILLYIVSFK
jgi:hypothetical protein